jgi:hypothetical protein
VKPAIGLENEIAGQLCANNDAAVTKFAASKPEQKTFVQLKEDLIFTFQNRPWLRRLV